MLLMSSPSIKGGRWYLSGDNVNRVNGGPVPLARIGSRDHYSDSLPRANNLMREYGYAERWRISNLDLAILADLGYEILQWLPKGPSKSGSNSQPSGLNAQASASGAATSGFSADPFSGDQASKVSASSLGGGVSDELNDSPELFWLSDYWADNEPDTVIRFSADRGDQIVVSADTFGGVTRVKFQSVQDRQSLRTASSSGKNFVYVQWQGSFYFNENGKSSGWGEGGSVAQIDGAALISKQALVLI